MLDMLRQIGRPESSKCGEEDEGESVKGKVVIDAFRTRWRRGRGRGRWTMSRSRRHRSNSVGEGESRHQRTPNDQSTVNSTKPGATSNNKQFGTLAEA
ncbi:hypothetical protein CAEBREN_00902 [Caenorhabditis brenneri]|uniref:Uncharacterized protein n=1 Tax=Caenorhabditis brenneri TaxID=135651 RepID=G0NC01_CAEBE|nr:hypothetical protein CAEBREN_00902 [Caenorhabditis brenneri]